MQNDQDSLNTAAGGNIFYRTPKDVLTIIENKLKVRTPQNKPVVSPQFRNKKSIGELLAEEQVAKVNAQFCKSFVQDDDDEEPLEEVKIDPLIKESLDILSMGDKEVEVNPLEKIDDLVPIPRVSEKPFELTAETFDIIMI